MGKWLFGKSRLGKWIPITIYNLRYNIKNDIDFAVFPSLQGGPHNNTIAGVATALREAMSEDFVLYQQQVPLGVLGFGYIVPYLPFWSDSKLFITIA